MALHILQCVALVIYCSPFSNAVCGHPMFDKWSSSSTTNTPNNMTKYFNCMLLNCLRICRGRARFGCHAVFVRLLCERILRNNGCIESFKERPRLGMGLGSADRSNTIVSNLSVLYWCSCRFRPTCSARSLQWRLEVHLNKKHKMKNEHHDR